MLLVFGFMMGLVFYYVKVIVKFEVSSWVFFVFFMVMFGVVVVGISYGVLSVSWDF